MAEVNNAAAAILLLDDAGVVTPPPARPFGVWVGSDSGGFGRTFGSLVATALALVPPGVDWTEIQILVKAGEGGSWQAALSGEPLAIRSAAHLADMVAQGTSLGVRVVPYVVNRGRPAWAPFEQQQISECVRVAGLCVCNVEPGAPYWNGSTAPWYIRTYLGGCGVRPEQLQVALIPRQGQVDQLGGAPSIQAWTDPQYVGSAAWETYGITAGLSGPTSLLVNEAIPRLDRWGVPAEPQYRIPIVQRDERNRWADTPWTAAGMQVWFVDGN